MVVRRVKIRSAVGINNGDARRCFLVTSHLRFLIPNPWLLILAFQLQFDG